MEQKKEKQTKKKKPVVDAKPIVPEQPIEISEDKILPEIIEEKPEQPNKKEEKVFTSDRRELVKVEGTKDTPKGKLYYGIKK